MPYRLLKIAGPFAAFLAFFLLFSGSEGPQAQGAPRTCPAYPAFPDANCTGVLPGITRTNSGSITTSTAGQVIQNLNVTGRITVNHNNVTIRNVKITNPGGLAITNGCGSGRTGTLIEDVELDGTGNSTGASAVDCVNYTLRRANIHHFGEGPGGGNGILIEDSYLHDFTDQSASGAHQDGMQFESDDNNMVRHNTILMNRPNGHVLNAAIVFGGNTLNNTAEYNLVGGGGYTLYQGQAGGTFRHNRFTAVLVPAGYFGPVYANAVGPWSPEAPCDNLWADGPNVGQVVAGGGVLSCAQGAPSSPTNLRIVP